MSTGRLPMPPPPGSASLTFPKRASTGPINTEDALSCFVSSALISSYSAMLVSMTRHPFLKSVLQCRWFKIPHIARTSAISGQPRITVTPSFIRDAAITGSTAFFAPWIHTLPNSRFPPFITIFPKIKTPGEAIFYYIRQTPGGCYLSNRILLEIFKTIPISSSKKKLAVPP